MRSIRSSLLVCASLATASACADTQLATLKTNPFLQPADLSAAPVNRGSEQQAAEMALRATMVAGAHSQANIGGVIIGLGEAVNGYTLAEVHARHVVLERDGSRKEIRIDDSDNSTRD